MIGKRIYPDEAGTLVFDEPGTYGQDWTGEWWARPPKGSAGRLSLHKITEHEDGTISATPSILTPEWHGFLEHGFWRKV